MARQKRINQEEVINDDEIVTIDISSLPNRKKRGEDIKNGDIIDEKPEKDPLTKKQRAFVNEYVKDWNGYQAAKRAEYSDNGDNCYAQACYLLRLPKVQQEIAKIEKGLATRFISDKERILKELSLLAYSDLQDYLTEDGELRVKNLKELPSQITRAIKKLKIKSKIGKGEVVWQNIEFELYDKKASLELMGKEIGMFKETKEFTGANGKDLFPQTPGAIIFDFGPEEKQEDC